VARFINNDAGWQGKLLGAARGRGEGPKPRNASAATFEFLLNLLLLRFLRMGRAQAVAVPAQHVVVAAQIEAAT